MGRWMKKIKNKQYGQAMVEFALTIPVFLLLIFGVIELSRFFLVYSSVYTASREASRFGSSVGQIGSENYLDCDGIAAMAVNSGWFGGVTDLHSDPGELDVINIYFESSPGIVVGSCKKNIQTVDGVQTLIDYDLIECIDSLDNCTTDTYEPDLGDRVVVEVVSTYRPLLGIVPEMPVRALNGRTIMMEIKMRATAEPGAICSDDVQVIGNLGLRSDKKIAYIEIENVSDITNYQLISITDIFWTVASGTPSLEQIYWGGDLIWEDDGEVVIPDPDLDITEWTLTENRNLFAGDTMALEFVFSNEWQNLSKLEMDFLLEFQNANILTRTCTKAISK